MDAKRRIVHIVGRGDTYGGAQRYVESVAGHQLANGDEVTVWCGSDGVFVEHLADRGLPVVLLRARNAFASVIELRRWLVAACPDLVIVHSTAMCLLVRLALIKVDTPLVLTIHGAVFGPDRPPLQRLIGTVIEFGASRLRPSTMIAISEADQRRLNSWVVGSKNQIAMVPNWVDDLEPGPGDEPQHATGGARRIGMVARIDRPKRPDVLLRAVALVSEPIEVDLVGGGRPDSVLALAEQLGIGDRVHLHGEVDSVSAISRTWSVGVLVSDWEGVPLSVIEYLREGLPVVASDVGSVNELVDHGVNGFLLAGDDPRELAGALEPILNDGALRSQMGCASRKLFEQYRSPRSVIPMLLAAYDQTVRSLPGAQPEAERKPVLKP